MTDVEIFEWLYNLEPESKEQEKKIKTMMSVILKKEKECHFYMTSNTKKFLNTLSIDDVLDKKSSEVYMRYDNWCKEQKITPESKVVLTTFVQKKFNVKSIVTKVNGKCARYYKRDTK